VEEVGGEHRGCLGVQELPPGRVGVSLRRWRDLQRLEDPADGGCADPVAELEQLALDPLVSPAVVLGGEPVGAEYCVTSCDLRVFVDQAAEPVPPQNPDT